MQFIKATYEDDKSPIMIAADKIVYVSKCKNGKAFIALYRDNKRACGVYAEESYEEIVAQLYNNDVPISERRP